jgi:hypothetical protein
LPRPKEGPLDARRKTPFVRLAALLVALALPTAPTAARAEETGASASVSTEATPATVLPKAPWRGSMLLLRNEVSVLTFDKGAELTYNPYDALVFTAWPRWWFNDVFFVQGRVMLTHELTNADDTNRRGETLVSDVSLGAGASRFYTIPVLGVALGADVNVVLPSSKESRARTLAVGVGGRVMLARHFDLLAGFDLAYSLQASKGFYRYTTAGTETPLISGCSGDGDCSRFSNTGVRNPRFGLANRFDVSLDFLDWLGLELSAIHRMSFLLPAQDDDPRLSYVPQTPTNDRQTIEFEGNLRVRPMKSLELAVGVSSLAPILAPDSTFYTPFVNRYTMGFVELRLLIDGLVAQIVPNRFAE